MMSSLFRHILQQERAHLQRAAAGLFETFLTRKPEAEPAELFIAAGEVRQSIADVLRQYASQLDHEELIGLQSSLHAALDQQIEAAIRTTFERRIETLTDRAERDSLTKLPNRAAFERRLSHEIARAQRYQRDLALVLFDVDDFKQVNDQFGHPAGDQVLIAVARVLQTSLRRSDSVFRYGGDEFMALCPETSGSGIEPILRRVESNLFVFSAGTEQSQSASISWGVASFPADAANAEELIRLADQRLYSCKKWHHQGSATHA